MGTRASRREGVSFVVAATFSLCAFRAVVQSAVCTTPCPLETTCDSVSGVCVPLDGESTRSAPVAQSLIDSLLAAFHQKQPAGGRLHSVPDESGGLKARWHIESHGRMHGGYQLFHLNGMLRKSGQYHFGNPSGTWYEFDESGNVLQKQVLELAEQAFDPSTGSYVRGRTVSTRSAGPDALGVRRDEEGYTLADLQQKQQSYNGMIAGGGSLLVVGIISSVAAIVLMSDASWESSASPGNVSVTTSDESGGAGIVMLGIGVPATLVGVILASIGGRKSNEYKSRVIMFGGYSMTTRGGHFGLTMKL